MVYNFPVGNPRRAKITRFIDAFLGRLSDLQRPPRHPRWRDVNLGAAIVWMRDNRHVVFFREAAGDENWRAWCADLETGDAAFVGNQVEGTRQGGTVGKIAIRSLPKGARTVVAAWTGLDKARERLVMGGRWTRR